MIWNSQFLYLKFIKLILRKLKKLSKNYFRRNYHSSALLLTDGTILVSGGDVWNSEIFYPPYLFTKDINNRTVLARRPVISKIESDIKRGLFEIELDEKKSFRYRYGINYF